MDTLYIKWSVLRRESCSFQMVKNHTQASRGLQSCCILPRCCLEHAWACNRCRGRMSMWPRTTPQLTAEWHQETWLLRVATGSKNALFEVIVCCLGCPGSIEKRNCDHCDHLSQLETQRIYSKPSAQNSSYASDSKKCLFLNKGKWTFVTCPAPRNTVQAHSINGLPCTSTGRIWK